MDQRRRRRRPRSVRSRLDRRPRHCPVGRAELRRCRCRYQRRGELGLLSGGTRTDGSLAERAIVNRDGSTIQSEFADPGKPSDWDERHTVTLPEGGKTTFETADRTQTIRDGGPDGEVVSRSTWTERGPEREATVQEARTPSRPSGAPLAETTITSALTLFNWLSARNKLDGLQAVAGFNAGDYAPSADAIDLSFVGQLREEEVDRACPRFQEVRSRTDAAVDAVGPRSGYPKSA
jgi:hypothetical protein